ncbi:predicted protein [Nematostella vectensis]|uniref:Chloride channel CLIC-like protein 1 n=1 Tax=Nematostella vectensis TaxID=45351 RepID=A7RTX7_NEMVE|nr:predicted protein [Nematostella vectensis]|eukprot:XP_001637171.1 predicted protein [Nematostella vectensis]
MHSPGKSTLLVFTVLICSGMCDVEVEDKSVPVEEWIDPDNMVLEPLVQKRLKTSQPHVENSDGTKLSQLKAQLEDCSQKLYHANQQLKMKGVTTVCDLPHLKQLVRALLSSVYDLHPIVTLEIKDKDRKSLEKFLLGKANEHDTSELLLRIINTKVPSSTLNKKTYEIFNAYMTKGNILGITFIFVLLSCIIAFELMTSLSAYQQFLYLMVTFFMLSIPWEWFRLYKVAFVTKQVELMKKMPKHCKPDHELGVFESISIWWQGSFTFSDDTCTKYQEALLVDPLWEVTPSMAVSVTITRFFIKPLEYVAEAFGKSFRALFKEVPVQWQPFMFILVALLLVLILLFITGVHINFPFLQIGVGRGPEGNIGRLENKVQKLTALLERMNEQRPPAIEDVEEIENRADRQQAMLHAMNEGNQRMEAEMREMQGLLQRVMPALQAPPRPDPQEADWEVVADEERPRLRQPVQACEHSIVPSPVEHVGPSGQD